MSKLRVFLSYDREHDEDLVEQLVALAAAAGSGFEIVARSRRREEHDLWYHELRRQVRAADEVIVLCGEFTGESLRVGAELRIAQEEKRPYMLLWGRREIMCKKPLGAKTDDAMYGFSLDVIREHMQLQQRVAHEGERLMHMRRKKDSAAG